MAALYQDADVDVVRRLARLLDEFERGERGGVVLSEIRQLEDRLGLSPLARRRLAWDIAAAGASAASTDAVAPAPVIDEDRLLRVVK